eukprot:TRINITY_DN3533_c3_g1_i1.p1 TRINITY_DN3533_c3_g1~~TRINITY_DN3533_c3_g1_i1.p1  ORF type:complete len:247 (+),score=42.50 TRINITY_DN3533_c3_g1_i1:57-743(+)
MTYWQVGKVPGNVPNWYLLELLGWKYQIVKRMFSIERVVLRGEGFPVGLPSVMEVGRYDKKDHADDKTTTMIQVTLTHYTGTDFDMHDIIGVCNEMDVNFELFSAIVLEKGDKRHQQSSQVARFFLRPLHTSYAKRAFLQWDATPCHKYSCFVHCSPPMSPSISKKTICYKIPPPVIPALIPFPEKDVSNGSSSSSSSNSSNSTPTLPRETFADVGEALEYWGAYMCY